MARTIAFFIILNSVFPSAFRYLLLRVAANFGRKILRTDQDVEGALRDVEVVRGLERVDAPAQCASNAGAIFADVDRQTSVVPKIGIDCARIAITEMGTVDMARTRGDWVAHEC